ncbi:hypothetical protein ABSA28_00530 [Candidatus Hepatincolaceae symbiont of Richtersius coronifer]
MDNKIINTEDVLYNFKDDNVSTRVKILDITTHYIQLKGLNAFSYKDFRKGVKY